MPFVLGSISPYNQSYLIYFYSVGPFSALSFTKVYLKPRRHRREIPCISLATAVTAECICLTAL